LQARIAGALRVQVIDHLIEATEVTLPILLKIKLMEFAIGGMLAPAATAMNPASRAYSTMS
jgi:hypothetical protein